MLRRVSEIKSYKLRSFDGELGHISDLLFDEQSWAVRWVLVDTGSWLLGREVLLPPSQFKRIEEQSEELLIELTREQIENSPGLDAHAPVSRQWEKAIYAHYGWQPYWYGYPGYVLPSGGAAAIPPGVPSAGLDRGERSSLEGDPHLRSSSEVTGYYIRATDGSIGHVEDFVVDLAEDETWIVRYMMVDTKNWWPGKVVLVSPSWVHHISWGERQVHVGLKRDQIKTSPEYHRSEPIDRDYEVSLHRHYGISPYWGP